MEDVPMSDDATKQAAYEEQRAARRQMAGGGVAATVDATIGMPRVAKVFTEKPVRVCLVSDSQCPSPDACEAKGCWKEKPAVPGARVLTTAEAVRELDTGTRAGAILRKAAEIVDGPRNATHGDKERSFAAIAKLWDAYLEARAPHAGGDPHRIAAADVCAMMVLLKFARSEHGQHVEDHGVDAAGYAAIWSEMREAAARA